MASREDVQAQIGIDPNVRLVLFAWIPILQMSAPDVLIPAHSCVNNRCTALNLDF